MKKLLNFKQELTACFGKPISENPTQVMMEAAFKHHDLDWRYLTIEVDPRGLKDAVRGAKAMGFKGFNCTMPHKVSVIHLLDGLGESAKLMKAVNCVVRQGDKFIGENTDGKGFLKALSDITDVKNKKVLMFGGGGAARAIGTELGLAGAASVIVVNRGEKRGSELVRHLARSLSLDAEAVLWTEKYRIPEDVHIVINATSIGLYPDIDAKLNIDFGTLDRGMVVADVIPNPPRTHLITESEKRGCKIIDGLKMLINQGVIGIKYWSGIDADAAVMRKALEKTLGV